jgi:hypothetical protein
MLTETFALEPASRHVRQARMVNLGHHGHQPSCCRRFQLFTEARGFTSCCEFGLPRGPRHHTSSVRAICPEVQLAPAARTAASISAIVCRCAAPVSLPAAAAVALEVPRRLR